MADLSGKKVAILVDNYFEQAEFTEPKKALQEAGVAVEVVSPTEGDLQGLNHVEKGDTFQRDVSLDDADLDDYDALVLPGGAINADSLRMNEAARSWVRQYIQQDKPLAVICHAPWVLVSAGCVTGVKLTSFETIQDDIRNAGGEWVDQAVVVDGNLITSRKPDDLPAFNEALLQKLAETEG
jgi:protease I